jgi:alpha-1,3-rhamnosyl/mannosyltransferase
VIAISEATRQDFRREFGLSAERIVTIPLGVESRFCPQGEGEVERVRRKYGLPERFVFCLGSGRPHKNLAALVSAWGEIRPAGWQLIFGGAREANWLEGPRLPEGIDPPRWIGFVPESDLPSLYSAASLFVFPSLYEGFGLPVLEAMACGAPVVCGRVSSLPEVGGDAALYFDLHATGSLAQALENALGAADLRGELAAKGRERAATFTWARCAQATAQIYRDLG